MNMTNEQKLVIWDREFNLEVRFYNFPGEEITDLQKQTVNQLKYVDFNQTLVSVSEYILENNREELGRNEIDNVFRYVKPKYILVFRSKENRQFALMCNYRFDEEHGIALFFKDEQLISVTPQDDVL